MKIDREKLLNVLYFFISYTGINISKLADGIIAELEKEEQCKNGYGEHDFCVIHSPSKITCANCGVEQQKEEQPKPKEIEPINTNAEFTNSEYMDSVARSKINELICVVNALNKQ